MTRLGVTLRGAKAAAVTLVAVTVAYGFAAGPPAGRTGAPGEATCVQCHTGTLNSGAGSVAIEGVPDVYEPGQEYTLTVRVSHPDRRRWGFQITALDAQNRPAGTLGLVNRNLTRAANGTGGQQGRTYVEHTAQGTFAGQPSGASWEVRWTAPAQDIGQVTFYAAGNAANNNNASSGDNIYTTSVATGASAPTIIAPVFKKGKILLQANGSNIADGATLEITREGEEPESFPLVQTATGTRWQVKKKARSVPSARLASEVIPEGATVTLVVRNPDGMVSAPATLSR
jgi:hypothetical protein